MRKVLFTATVTNHINAFHIPYLKMFKENGYEVHVASKGNEKIEYCDKHYNIQFERSPLKLNNIKAYKELKKIINENNYEIIHCHTPVGGVLTRLAARKARKKGTRVIYTAHGFHFYKGAQLLNWLIYYPIEKWLSKYTDCLITINQEDYERAKRKFKKCKQIELVHGVGVEENKFNLEMKNQEKEEVENQIGLKANDFVLLEIGELNKNKNQIMAINAMKNLTKKNPNIHLLIVGKGQQEDFYKTKINEYKLENNIHMLGFRKDIPQLLKISDVLLSLSYREGLPVNVMEAMASGLPVIATDCRGNRDLILNGQNGYIVKTDDTVSLKEKILFLSGNINVCEQFKEKSKDLIKKYGKEEIETRMEKIYFNREMTKCV